MSDLPLSIEDEFPPPTNLESWPAQARLAAGSRWAELRKLQESLRGGVAPKAQ